jgi:hypothetical protein
VGESKIDVSECERAGYASMRVFEMDERRDKVLSQERLRAGGDSPKLFPLVAVSGIWLG